MSETMKTGCRKLKELLQPPGVSWPTRKDSLRQTGVVLCVAAAVSLLMVGGEAACGLLLGLIL